MKHSAQQIRAAAEAAITAKFAVDKAQEAFDADPEDDSLKTALDSATTAHTTAKNAADALSQEDTPKYSPEQVAKMKRRKAIIESQLQEAGATDDTDDEDDDSDDIDEDKPLTMRDLKRIDADKAQQNAMQLADAVADPLAKAAIKEAMKTIKPSGNAATDFQNAVAIANIGKNNKILEEIARKAPVTQHGNGAGAPPPQNNGKFEPTAEEARFMKVYGLKEADIVKAREESAAKQR